MKRMPGFNGEQGSGDGAGRKKEAVATGGGCEQTENVKCGSTRRQKQARGETEWEGKGWLGWDGNPGLRSVSDHGRVW